MEINFNDNYWNEFYSNNKKFSENQSSFCDFVIEYLKDYPKHKTLVDLGCGNGRDLCHFVDKGYKCIGIDSSQEICSFLQKEGNLNIICDSYVTHNYDTYDIYYSRFSLHAISHENIEKFIFNISNTIQENSLFFIETRSIKNTEYENENYHEAEFFSGIGELHKRTLLNKKYLIELFKKHNIFPEYENEDIGLSPYKNEDPCLIRLVMKKNQW